jgi:hypothetical protein
MHRFKTSQSISCSHLHIAKDSIHTADGKGIVVPLVGFELTTYRLQGGCSTN